MQEIDFIPLLGVMEELENLLLSLLERGWSPFGIDGDTIAYLELDIKNMNIHIRYTIIDEEGDEVSLPVVKSIRDLVSLEGGLWQFIIENKLYKPTNYKYEVYLDYKRDRYDALNQSDTNYRIIESALLPKEELGKFLLDNIKVEGNSK